VWRESVLVAGGAFAAIASAAHEEVPQFLGNILVN